MKKGRKVISPFSVVLLMGALALIGVFSLTRLDVQYLPDTAGTDISVSYSCNGASADWLEAEVTSRIEGVLVGLSGCTGIQSYSQDGSGNILLTFGKGTDMEAVRLEAVTQIRNLYPFLPKGMDFPVISNGSNKDKDRVAISYILKGSLPAGDMARYARHHLLTPLSSLESIDAVSISGAMPYRWVVSFNPDILSTTGISPSNLAAAIREAHADASVGMVHTHEGRLSARLIGNRSDSFGKIPVRSTNGEIWFLQDLATWRYEEPLPSSYFRVNGLNAIYLSISLAEGANLLTSIRKIKQRMDTLQATLPEGVSVSIAYDSSEYFRSELQRIFLRTGLCIIILLLFVFLISRSWRYLIVIMSTLTVNLLSSIAFYSLFSIPIHIYTLAGITVSLGIVIDTSIVMADHYKRKKDRKVFPALLSATVTTVGALLLTTLLPEEELVNLSDFIKVIVMNLSISLIVAYLFIPSLIDLIFPETEKRAMGFIKKRRLVKFSNHYRTCLAWCIRYRWLLVLIVTLSTIWPMWRLNKLFDWKYFHRQPQRQELYIQAGMQEGCTVAQLNGVVRQIESYLAGFDEIESFITRINSYDNATITVHFTPEVEKTAFPLRLKEQITTIAMANGGAMWDVSGIDENGFHIDFLETPRTNRIILTGYQYRDLVKYAEELKDYLNRNPRVSGSEIRSGGASHPPRTSLLVNYDFERMAIRNITPYLYHNQLSSQLWESHAGTILWNDEKTDVILRSSQEERYDRWNIHNSPLLIDSAQVVLRNVGHIKKEQAGLDIIRINQSYQLDVCFSFIGNEKQLLKTLRDAVDYMNQGVLPIGYKAQDFSGLLQITSPDRYYWLLGLILIFVGVVLSISFESFRLPFSVLIMIPVSYTGVFCAFGLLPFPFDQGGFAAMVLLGGIVVNAGIYITMAWLLSGGNGILCRKDRIRLYVKVFSYKITPILLTVISTVLGLIPFLLGPEDVFWFSFAVGTISGMLFSIPALLFLFPAFLLR